MSEEKAATSYLLVAGKAGAELGGSAQSWSWSAPLALPRIAGTFDAMVKATEDLQRADNQIESCLRRVERGLTEADKELAFRADSQEVFAELSGNFPDTIAGQKAPSPGGFYFKVGTHGGTNSLYRNEEGVWLYFEEDGWYVDAGKYPGDGKRSGSYFFKNSVVSNNQDASMGGYDSNGATTGACKLSLKLQPFGSPEICLYMTKKEEDASKDEKKEREFKVLLNEKWTNVDEALAKKSWGGGQGAWDEAKFSTRLPVQDLLSEMTKQAAEYDDTFKAFNQKYNEDKNKKTTLVVKDTLSHATRDLIEVLTPSTVKASTPPDVADDFIETNSLTSMICVVPQGGDEEFLNWYESGGAGVAKAKRAADIASGKVKASEEQCKFLKNVEDLNKDAADTDPVIPRSAKKLDIKPDKDGFSLWRVVVYHKDFNKAGKDGECEARKEGPALAFTKACRDSKYIVRDYKFSPEIFAKSIAERELALGNFTTSHVGLLKTGTKSFAALFDIWMHMKILRLAVEATLRYGSVDQCGAHLLCPDPAKITELRKALSSQISNKQDLTMLDDTDEDAAADNFPYCNIALTPLSAK